MWVAGPELAFRLAVTALVVVTPTLLFLGLIRLLERVRDEDLLYRLLTAEQLRDIEQSHSLASFVDEATGTAPGTIRCPNCGAINDAGVRSCHDCGTDLG